MLKQDLGAAAAPLPRDGRRTPPCISGPPPYGALPQFLQHKLDFLLEMHAQHGDVFSLDLGTCQPIILCHPDYAQHVLREHHSNYSNKGEGRCFQTAVFPLLSAGVASRNPGPAWLELRRLDASYFHHDKLGTLIQETSQAISDSLDRWEPLVAAGRPIDLAREMPRLAMEIMLRTTLKSCVADLAEADRLAQAFQAVLDYLWQGMVAELLPASMSPPEWLTGPGRERYIQGIATIHEITQRLIDRWIRSQEDARTLSGGYIQLLWQILSSGEQQQPFNEMALRSQVLTILLTGYESVAAALSYCLDQLSRNNRIFQKLHIEAELVLGSSKPSFADLSRLSYARMVFMEALRILPPVFWTQRGVAEDDCIAGYHIPAGTIVMPMIHLIHHHREFWERPHEFLPERFSPEQIAAQHKFAWMPFGLGPRKCPAQEFALLQGQLALSQFAQRYQIAALPEQIPQVQVASNQRLTGNVPILLRIRAR